MLFIGRLTRHRHAVKPRSHGSTLRILLRNTTLTATAYYTTEYSTFFIVTLVWPRHCFALTVWAHLLWGKSHQRM